jgi:sigma-B regulation protein RsbU (phosphoserine phosphatase)
MRTQAASLGALVVAVGALLTLGRVNRRVMPLIDRRFFREAYSADRILIELGREVRDLAARPEELLPTVTGRIARALHPRYVAAYLSAEMLDELHLEASPGVEDPVDSPDRFVRVTARHEPGTPPPPALLPEPASAEEGLRVPIVEGERQMGALLLGDKLSEEPYSGRDRELLRAVAEQAGAALERARLIRRVADQEKLSRELEIAEAVQARLLPQQPPPLTHLRCAGFCRPARGVGGDYYDFLELTPGLLGLALGDISGKGISAALLMANLQALLRGRAPMHGREVERVAADINRLLLDSTETNRYATFFYGVFDDDASSLRYVNAGHNPPLILREAGGGRPPETIALKATGMVVGLMEGQEYGREELLLRPGDLLLVFSDGVTEAQGVDEEEFGEHRLIDLAAAHMSRDVEKIRGRIVDELGRFVGEYPQHDDMTLIVAKVV